MVLEVYPLSLSKPVPRCMPPMSDLTETMPHYYVHEISLGVIKIFKFILSIFRKIYCQQSTALCSLYFKFFSALTTPGLHSHKTITAHLQYLCNQKRSSSLIFYSFCFYGASGRLQQWPSRCRDLQTIGFYEVTMSVLYKTPPEEPFIDELKLVSSHCSKRRYLVRGW